LRLIKAFIRAVPVNKRVLAIISSKFKPSILSSNEFLAEIIIILWPAIFNSFY
jgi:hypothetical protein